MKSKVRRSWLVLLAVLVLVAGACGDDEPAVNTGGPQGQDRSKPRPTFQPGTTMANIQARGKLIVGIKYDQPLFGLKSAVSGQVEGFDVEIAKHMAVAIFGGDIRSVADKVEFVETVSQNRETFLGEGRVDVVVATYTINDTRKQRVDFAGPYLVADQDIMVRSDDNSIKGVNDLNGKKVCSATGSTSLKNVQAQAPRADISIVFDKYSLCAEALADRRVDAVSTDDAILAGLVNDNPGKFKLVGADLSDEPYGIGVKKGDDAFRNVLNTRLEEIFTSGEWEEAFRSTVGRVIKEVPLPPPVNRYPSTAGAPAAGSTTTSTAGGTTTSSTTSSTTSTTIRY